jgi:hypothetical protein
MLLLTATNQTLEAVAATAASTDWTSDWGDHTSSAFTPTSLQGNQAGIGTITLVTAPASASHQIQVKAFSLHPKAAQTLTIQKNVGGTLYILFGPVIMASGETLIFTETAGFQIFDTSGRLKAKPIVGQPIPNLRPRSGFSTAGLGSTKSLTTGTAFAAYLGKAQAALGTIKVQYRVTTAYVAGGGTPYCEIAVATGAPSIGANPTLTVVGYADISAVANSTGIKTTTITVSGGQAINEGDDLWIIIGNKTTTTVAVVRAESIADDLQAGFQAAVATTQPSAVVGTPTVYTVEGATVLAMWFDCDS